MPTTTGGNGYTRTLRSILWPMKIVDGIWNIKANLAESVVREARNVRGPGAGDVRRQDRIILEDWSLWPDIWFFPSSWKITMIAYSMYVPSRCLVFFCLQHGNWLLMMLRWQAGSLAPPGLGTAEEWGRIMHGSTELGYSSTEPSELPVVTRQKYQTKSLHIGKSYRCFSHAFLDATHCAELRPHVLIIECTEINLSDMSLLFFNSRA